MIKKGITTYPLRSNIPFINFLIIKIFVILLENQKIYIKHLLKMINFDVTGEKRTHSILDHSCRILIIGCSGSGKANALLKSINYQPDIDKIYSYTKDPYIKQNINC